MSCRAHPRRAPTPISQAWPNKTRIMPCWLEGTTSIPFGCELWYAEFGGQLIAQSTNQSMGTNNLGWPEKQSNTQ
uniref:Uncharacterized protein n=1 Tax=Oryza rufipogon TaxID=4529 RepID=A0A0E0QPF8_ORYRU